MNALNIWDHIKIRNLCVLNLGNRNVDKKLEFGHYVLNI